MRNWAFSVLESARKSSFVRSTPTCKRDVTPEDIEIVGDLALEGTREAYFADILQGRSKGEIQPFFAHILCKCAMPPRRESTGYSRKQEAALLVFSAHEVTVGYTVLGEFTTNTIKSGIEIMMFGIVPEKRGMGYGAAILDSLIQSLARHSCNIVVRCPSNAQLFYAMLITRGFLAIGRYPDGRVLCLSTHSSTFCSRLVE